MIRAVILLAVLLSIAPAVSVSGDRTLDLAGDGCCVGRVGDVNGSGEDEPSIGDVSCLIDAKFITGACPGILNCMPEADVNLSGGGDPTCEDITIGDISMLID